MVRKCLSHFKTFKETLKYLFISILITIGLGLFLVHKGWSSLPYEYMIYYLIYLSVLMLFVHICLIIIIKSEI